MAGRVDKMVHLFVNDSGWMNCLSEDISWELRLKKGGVFH